MTLHGALADIDYLAGMVKDAIVEMDRVATVVDRIVSIDWETYNKKTTDMMNLLDRINRLIG